MSLEVILNESSREYFLQFVPVHSTSALAFSMKNPAEGTRRKAWKGEDRCLAWNKAVVYIAVVTA